MIGREKEGVGTEIEREMHVSRYIYMFLYVLNTEGERIEEGRETERAREWNLKEIKRGFYGWRQQRQREATSHHKTLRKGELKRSGYV